MKYNTRSSNCDLIILKEVRNSVTKEENESNSSLDCTIIISKKGKKSLKKNKNDSRNFSKKPSKSINKKKGRPKILASKFKKTSLKENKIRFSVPKSLNKCSHFINRLNELEQIKPCSVILERINVKQFKSNIRASNFYGKYKLNQTIYPCFVSLKRISVKEILNNTKPCSVDLKKFDFKQKSDKTFYKIKQEIVSCDEVISSFSNPSSHSSKKRRTKDDFEQNTNCDKICFKIEQEIESSDENVSSFTNSLSLSSMQYGKCVEQDKNKQFQDSNITCENEILLNEYFCTHCNKVLPSKKALYYHICNIKIKKGFLCEICFKNFDFYHLLIKHKSFHDFSLSCSKTVKNRRKSSPSPFIKLSTIEQSLRESNKFNCVSAGKCELKENNPPKKQNSKKKFFLKNPTCASTSSGYCSSKLEFLPYVWESDESSTDH